MRSHLKMLAGALCAAGLTTAAQANTLDDTSLASPGVYFGGGNSGLNRWATTTADNIEIGLTTHNRYVGQVAPDAGTSTYRVNTGLYAGQGGGTTCIGLCALWNIDFSVNLGTSGFTLADGSVQLDVLNVGTGQHLTFDPFHQLPDNDGYSHNANTNTNTFDNPATTSDIGFQNSENLHYFSSVPGFSFDPNANDTYLVSLLLTGPQGQQLSVDETVIAGTGATPLPAALPLFMSGLGAFGLLGWRKKRKLSVAAA